MQTSGTPQAIMADAGHARQASHETRQRVRHPYVLRGRLYCGYCDRKMQGQYNHGAAYYRCRYPKEYALASHIRHPGNVYLREADVVPAIDRWLSAIFAPRRLDQTIRDLAQAQGTPPAPEPAGTTGDTQAIIADCDARMARYQAALDAGADAETVAGWTRQVKAERAAALARDASHNRRQAGRRLTEDDIRGLITTLGDLRDVIRDADAATKTAIYDQLGLRLTYKPGEAKIRADITTSADRSAQLIEQRGDTGRVRGGT